MDIASRAIRTVITLTANIILFFSESCLTAAAGGKYAIPTHIKQSRLFRVKVAILDMIPIG